MREDETLDPALAPIVGLARQPVSLGDAARARIMLAVQAEAVRGVPGAPAPRFGWAFEPRPLRLSPVAAMAMAASLVGLGVAVGLMGRSLGPAAPDSVAAATAQPSPVTPDVLNGFTPAGVPVVPAGARAVQVKFVLVAPQASEVTVVGNFNDWNPAAHPMRRTATGGTWTVTVPLEAGRHEYSFVVDGKHWMPDPAAPLAPEDGFGVANSVLLVTGSTS